MSDHIPDWAVFALGTWLVTNGTFWGLGLFLEFARKNGWFRRYKLQPTKEPDDALVRICLREAVLKSVLDAVVLYFAYPVFRKTVSVSGPLPHFTTYIWQPLVWFIINDALFYWAHRLLHYKPLYGAIHKKHHQFKTPIGLAAQYAHPVEKLIANDVPTMVGALLMKTHVTVLWWFLFLRLWETVEVHSGFHFPWSPWTYLNLLAGGPDRHDFHHSHNIGNYGMLRFWDWIMSTDVAYEQWVAKGRGKNSQSNNQEGPEIHEKQATKVT